MSTGRVSFFGSSADAAFFVTKLQVQVLPALIFFRNGVAFDRIVGFAELEVFCAGRDAVRISSGARLLGFIQSGLLNLLLRALRCDR